MPDDPLGWFNAAEALVWFAYGALLLAAWIAGQAAGHERTAVVAGLAFLAFGGSDLVEIRTGTWWSPWWLLVWKAACVVVLVGCFLRYRAERADSPGNTGEGPAD